tara:strand:+ start:1665 stop:1802 length:138 start_codon:yes stop_codon:yes gene_type:complete
MIDKIYFLWIYMIIVWNIGYPDANPWLDVFIAILISIIIFFFRKK